MSVSSVRYSVDSGLGIIHMADGRGNRLNLDSLAAIDQALDRALSDDEVRIVIIRSGEESFCLGMDLDNLGQNLSSGSAGDSDAASSRTEAVESYGRLLYRIASCAKPVIALVEGAVVAGGVGLAAACDIVIADERASWELSEVIFSLVPYNVLPWVFGMRMSPQRFRYLVLSAKKIGSTEARDFGLADEIHPTDKLERGLKSLIKTMMRAEPGALASAKAFFADMNDKGFSERRKAGTEALTERMKDPRVLEGLDAFARGELPPWFGRFRPGAAISGVRDEANGEQE